MKIICSTFRQTHSSHWLSDWWYPGWTTLTRTGRPSCLPIEPSTVGVECSSMADLPQDRRTTSLNALVSLHWLCIPQQIEYEIVELTYKTLHGSAPRYLVRLVPVADLLGRRTLCYAGTSRLSVPSIRLSTVGSRTFPVAGMLVHESGMPCHRRRRQPSRCHCSDSVWSGTFSDGPIQTSSSDVLYCLTALC